MTTVDGVEAERADRPDRARGGDGDGLLLEVRGLKVHFPITEGIVLERKVGAVQAVDGVDLDLRRGDTLGLVGESGCGKTTVGRTILRLIEPTEGTIRFDGEDITGLRGEPLRSLRRRMQMIFQDPYSSLDPRQTVGSIVREPLQAHGQGAKKTAERRVRELLDVVGLPANAANRYPHEFSGGQRQRVGIARALALQPELIVADEPVSALDVSIQAQVINLLEELQEAFHLTYLVIAHDLGVVRHISDRVAVMYLGVIVEEGPTDELFDHPLHPYTLSLLSAVPVPDPTVEDRRDRIVLRGDVPSPIDPPPGCRFHTRCPYRQPTRCHDEVPALRLLRPGHKAACHWAEEIEAGRIQPHDPPDPSAPDEPGTVPGTLPTPKPIVDPTERPF